MRPLPASFVRFVVVGVVSNVTLYLVYLVLTRVGVGPKTAMTALYVVGILATFVANRRWSFASRTSAGGAFLRYVASYLVGYGVNLSVMVLLVDIARFPHELVQAGLILVVACLTFLLQRYWVFAGGAAQGHRS